MSAMGHERHFERALATSVLTPCADMLLHHNIGRSGPRLFSNSGPEVKLSVFAPIARAPAFAPNRNKTKKRHAVAGWRRKRRVWQGGLAFLLFIH
jgi:hypothetical protein